MIERKSDLVLYFLVALLLILGSAYAAYLGNTLRFLPDERYSVRHPAQSRRSAQTLPNVRSFV
jgi:hypothetical protein